MMQISSNKPKVCSFLPTSSFGSANITIAVVLSAINQLSVEMPEEMASGKAAPFHM